MTELSDISFLTVYNSALITALSGGFIYLMKRVNDLCGYKAQQEQKEIDKDKYENHQS